MMGLLIQFESGFNLVKLLLDLYFILFYHLFVFPFFEFFMSNAFGTQTNLEAGKSCSLRLHVTLLAVGKFAEKLISV